MENDMEAQREKRPLKHLQGLKGRVQNSLSGFLRACIVAVLVAFQFAILIVLPFLLRQYASLFYLFSGRPAFNLVPVDCKKYQVQIAGNQ